MDQLLSAQRRYSLYAAQAGLVALVGTVGGLAASNADGPGGLRLGLATAVFIGVALAAAVVALTRSALRAQQRDAVATVNEAVRAIPSVADPSATEQALEATPTTWAGAHRQLTQRTRALAAALDFRDAALSGMDVGLLVVNSERQCIYQNRKLAEILRGRSVVGMVLLEAFRKPEILDVVTRVLETGTAQLTQVDSGEGAHYGVSALPLALAGRHQHVLVVFQNISTWVGSEIARRDMVANVSHELRTPVASILGYSETLLASPQIDPDRARHFVQIIHRNGVRLAEMIQSLLDLHQLDANAWTLTPARVDLDETVAELREMLSRRAEEKGLRLHTEGVEGVSVFADPTGVQHVLQNLLENAVKYSDAGVVTVRAEALDAGVVRIDVIDEGPGIPDRFRERVFERFFRVDKGRSREKGGSGLGLSIARNLVRRMGGEIGVGSNPAGGSIFWFTLPRDEPTARQRPPTPAIAMTAINVRPAGHGLSEPGLPEADIAAPPDSAAAATTPTS
jgi:two-component system, OmpR family, phosphate regulon sensor histidine kinase PhoR